MMKNYFQYPIMLIVISIMGFSHQLSGQVMYKITDTKDIDMKLSGTSTLHKWSMDARTFEGEADLIYRLPKRKENFWVGVRYNTVTATLQGNPNDITIQREVCSAGWFLTKNIMLKAEYVNQVYLNYPTTNILNGGKFYGTMVEASIGF